MKAVVVRFGAAAALLSWVVSSGDAFAQMSSEAPARARTVPVAEVIKAQLEYSRFRLGPLRVQPFFALRDLGYNSNVLGTVEGEAVGDWTASAAAGVRLLAPLGSKLVVRGTAAPEYTWYLDLEQKRGWGGLYEGSLLGLFNRMTAEAGGGYLRDSRSISSEIEEAVFQDRTYGYAKLEVELLRRLSLFGGVAVATTKVDEAGSVGDVTSYEDLNRTETGYRGGLRYQFLEHFSLSGQVEWITAEFVNDPVGRDNESTGYLLVARYDRPRFYLDLSGGYREATGRAAGSTFPDFQELTYSYFASYFVTKRVELQMIGSRRPIDSVYGGAPYFFETRNGLNVSVGVGARSHLSASGALGRNEYPAVVDGSGGEIAARYDDFRELGGGVEYRVSPTLALGFRVTQTQYTSNLPGFDRTISRFSFVLMWTRDFVSIAAGTRY